MRSALLTTLLVAFPLAAQPGALTRLERRLASARQGLVVVLGSKAFQADFKGLVDQEPLVELLLQPLPLEPDLGAALALREGWPAGDRWAWMASDGKVRLSGTHLPTAQALRTSLLEAGWEDRGQLLERHLEAQPSAMNVWPELLQARWQVARRRMEPWLLPGEPGKGRRALRQPLPDADDARIWGPTAEALDAVFRQGSWALFALGRPGFPSELEMLPPEACHSLRVRAVCERHLPQVEAALLGSPDPGLLAAWWKVAQGLGRSPEALLRMVARLRVAPGSLSQDGSALAWVGKTALWGTCLQACRDTGDWKDLLKLLEEDLEPLSDSSLPPFLRSEQWRFNQGGARGLLEGLLRSGRPQEAERRVRAWNDLGLTGASALGAEVAEACQEPQLARTLRELRPGNPGEAPVLEKRWPRKGQAVLLLLGDGPLVEGGLDLSGTEDGLEITRVGIPGAEGLQVCRELGRPSTPRWMLLHRTGKVGAEGTRTLTREGLAQALSQAGIPSLRARLDAFLGTHPSHAAARWERVRLDLVRAARQMSPHLEPAKNDTLSADAGGGVVYRAAQPLPRLKAPLTETEDRRIWGSVAREIQALFSEVPWDRLTHPVDLPPLAAHSPLMQRAAGQALRSMEEVLARAPYRAVGLWRLWASYLAVAGPSGTLEFLDTLRPVPSLPELPPSVALGPVIKACREQGRWTLLRDLLERDRSRTWGRAGSQGAFEAFQGTWDTRIAPLVEAYLRLGDEAGAEAVVAQAHGRYPTRTLPPAAAAVALACGNRELAIRWSGLPTSR